MKYAYVCTNYNNADFTKSAIASLQQGSHPPANIVVVDNASDAEDQLRLDAIQDQWPFVVIIRNPENLGYFSGLNIGIARALEESPDLDAMVVGNNDLQFACDLGEKLSDSLKKYGDNPVISPNVITLDGYPQNPHVVSGISRPREFLYDLYYWQFPVARLILKIAGLARNWTRRGDEDNHAIAGHIYQGHGSVFILTKKFFGEFERLFDPVFLMYEEFFLSYQLAQKGYKIFYDPEITVRHHCNGAIGKIPSRKIWELAKESHLEYRRYIKPWHKQQGNFLKSK